MSDKNNPEFFRAEGEDAKYSNPLLRLLLSLGYLGIFGSIITIYMIVMSFFSKGKKDFEFEFAAAALIALALCTAAVIILNIKNRKEKKRFLENEKNKLKNAVRYNGRIIGAEKHIRHVKYMNDVFDEVIWNFRIEYFDEEKNELLTVPSEKFLSDISEVLADDSVTVCVSEDGSLFFENYVLKKNANDDFVELKIDVDERDS